MTIQGSSELKFENILVGEVWLCSGQSNMGWALGYSDDSDLEIMTANYPHLLNQRAPSWNAGSTN